VTIILTLGGCGGFVSRRCLGVAHCKPPPAGHPSRYLLLAAYTHINMTRSHTSAILQHSGAARYTDR